MTTAAAFAEWEVRAKALRWMNALARQSSGVHPQSHDLDTGIDDPEFLCAVASALAGIAIAGWTAIHGGDREAAIDALDREIAVADQLAAL